MIHSRSNWGYSEMRRIYGDVAADCRMPTFHTQLNTPSLPRSHPFTALIVHDTVYRVFYNRAKETLTEVRSKYWIVKGRSLTRYAGAQHAQGLREPHSMASLLLHCQTSVSEKTQHSHTFTPEWISPVLCLSGTGLQLVLLRVDFCFQLSSHSWHPPRHCM